MAARNTTEANVYWNGQRVAKITDISPQESRQVLDTTGIGQFADTSTYGGYSGSITGTLLYDPEDAATVALMNRIRSESDTIDSLRLISKTGDAQGDVTAAVLISQQSVSVAVRGLMSAQVSMTVSGPITGSW
jgi:hypothetical protein